MIALTTDTDRLRWATPTDRNRAELVALLTERTMAVVDPKHHTVAPTLTQAWYRAHAMRWEQDAYLDTLDTARRQVVDNAYESHLATTTSTCDSGDQSASHTGREHAMTQSDLHQDSQLGGAYSRGDTMGVGAAPV